MKDIYATTFGIRCPYQFIVDGTFCRGAFRHAIDLAARLPPMLGGTVRLFTTPCVMAALKEEARVAAEAARAPLPAAAGSAAERLRAERNEEVRLATGAMRTARAFELRRCMHGQALPTHECLLSIIGTENPFRYGVASDDDALKGGARDVPGVPLLYLERTFPLLEDPSRSTMRAFRAAEAAKLRMSAAEAAVIDRTMTAGEEGRPAAAATKIHRKRRIKGPNPLSVKASKKVPAVSVQDAPKKRTRRRKKEAPKP